MATMNIAGTNPVDDPEYRYKMPRLQAKIEGRGNGIKTLVVNCSDIALSLHRTPAEVCKFFGCELGAQSKYDEKSDRAIVNGAFDSQTLQQHLSKYIEGFVLCPNCHLPETKYKFKGQVIMHKCLACGAQEPVDLAHKLTTFILKEHTAAKRASKSDKKSKKDKKEKKDKSRDEPETEDKEKKDKKKKKDKKEKKDKKDKKEKRRKSDSAQSPDEDTAGDQDDDEDDVVWHTDLSAEAVAARAAEAEAIESAAQSAMGMAESNVTEQLDNLEVDDNALEGAVNNVRRFIQDSNSTDDIFDEVCRQQTNGAHPISDRLVIFFQAAFDDKIVAENQVEKMAPVLEKIVKGDVDQYRLIALSEHFCVIDYPNLLSAFPVVLKLFYDEDVLEEEQLIAWANGDVRKEYGHWEVSEEQGKDLKAKMQPFIEWLENASEESEDDE